MASKCTKCGNTDNYNFALNIGLCDICISEELERIKELEAENKMMFDEMCNMCFCKRRICKRCNYVEEMPDRCKNEQIRDKIFHKLSKP